MQATPGASLTPDGDVPGPAPAGSSPSSAPGRTLLLFAVVAAVVWSLDVVTKVWAVEKLTDRSPVDLIPGVLDLTLVRNPGAAFSVGTGFTSVLTVLALCIVAVVLRLSLRLRSRLWALALGLLLGGALGNLTDRMLRSPGPFRGYVVDFLRLPNWPVFNLADSAIVLAAALIALQSLRGIALDGARLSDDETPDAGAGADAGPDAGTDAGADVARDD
jgi:signal peptidase II